MPPIIRPAAARRSIDKRRKSGSFRLLPSPSAYILLTLPFVLALGYKMETEKSRLLPYFQESQALNWHVIQQFQAQKPVFARKSNVIFLHDPFEGWEMIFIAKLYSRDPSVRFILARLELPQPTERDLAAFDYVFDYQDGKLLQLKPPSEPRPQGAVVLIHHNLPGMSHNHRL